MKNKTTFKSSSPEETKELAAKLANGLRPGTVVALYGDLGAGKTLFAQAIGQALGVTEPMSSPTFTIRKDYEGRMSVHHFDAYRIGDIGEMDEIGCEDCFYGDGVSLVEWADLIEELLPEDALRVTIDRAPDDPSARVIEIEERR